MSDETPPIAGSDEIPPNADNLQSSLGYLLLFLKGTRAAKLDNDLVKAAIGEHATRQKRFEEIKGGSLEKVSTEDLILIAFMTRALPVKQENRSETWIWPGSEKMTFGYTDDGFGIKLDDESRHTLTSLIQKYQPSLTDILPEPQYAESRKSKPNEEFFETVKQILEESKQSDYTIELKKNLLVFRMKKHPEIYTNFALKPKDDRPEAAALQVEEAIRQFDVEWAQFETLSSSRLGDDFGVRKIRIGDKVKFCIPDFCVNNCSVDVTGGKTVATAMKELAALGPKIQAEIERRDKQRRDLQAKGFILDFQVTKENNPELVISHPDPAIGWATQVVPLTKTRDPLYSDAAYKCMKQAEETYDKAATIEVRPAPAAPKTNGVHVERERVKRGPDPNRRVVEDGVIKPFWKDNIAPRSSPNWQESATHSSNGNGKVLPKMDKVDIVIDSSVLGLLESKRSNHSQWLDILSVLETLPNINLVFPSYVADFELCGCHPHHNAEGDTSFHYAEYRGLEKSQKFHTQFFANASRCAVDDNGKPLDEAPPQRGLYVWESAEQQALYNELRQRLEHFSPGNEKYLEQLRLFRNKHANKGELFAYDYCNSKQCENPAIIVANDLGFAKRFGANQAAPLSTTSANGKGISVCSAKDFIDSLNAAFNGKLGKELGAFGNVETDTSYKALVDISNKTNTGHWSYNNLFKYVRGKANDGTEEKTLETVIREGLNMREHSPRRYSMRDYGIEPGTRQRITSEGIQVPDRILTEHKVEIIR